MPLFRKVGPPQEQGANSAQIPTSTRKCGEQRNVWECRWCRQGRDGQPCDVTVRGKMNSCLTFLTDGSKIAICRSAVAKTV